MSLTATFQRSMARLALMAMMALVLLPGIGRLSQLAADGSAVAAENGSSALLGAICTARGLVYDPAVAAIEGVGFASQSDDDSRSPAAPHAGDDCDYCTIASASNVPAPIALAPPAPTRDIAQRACPNHVAIWHYPRGLGSRGPPLKA